MSKVEKNGRASHDPEVVVKPERRRYTAEYKRKILEEADACDEPGEIGALLRREGLYSSLLTSWRRQREEGTLAGLEPKRRGRKAKRRDPVAVENERLRRENERLQHRLMQAEVIISVQKKLATALGIEVPTDDENGSNE
ncbi:MAG: transposase [Candidatus Eremiobacteraeota bacterium]|nr:transposase [Candidatus Eremiobacteraeota bacterium]MBV8354147.1 transposase [Candidatus Eremiobacteraeota bacterium]